MKDEDLDPSRIMQVSMSRREIVVTIRLLKQSIPAIHEQDDVVNIIEKLRNVLKL